MNCSMLTSDRATHLKIAMTAILAIALVVVVGICAQPADGRHGQTARDAGAPTIGLTFDRRVEAAR